MGTGSVKLMGHEDRDLFALGSTFDTVRRGYDRAQVDEHLDRLDADLRILAADRDAAVARSAELSKQLENQRAQITKLEQELSRLSTPPTTMEGLSERLQRMLRLAQDEAAEIKARAETEAAELVVRAEADGGSLRDRYQQLLADTENRRDSMETEHTSVLQKAEAEAARVLAEATGRVQQLEAESSARRLQEEEDFEIAMAARRANAMQSIIEQEASSRDEAERRIREASAEASRRLQEATEAAHQQVVTAQVEVDTLRTLRTRIAAQLHDVRSVLADAAATLEPAPQELPPAVVATAATANHR